jgi:hypothetical protein
MAGAPAPPVSHRDAFAREPCPRYPHPAHAPGHTYWTMVLLAAVPTYAPVGVAAVGGSHRRHCQREEKQAGRKSWAGAAAMAAAAATGQVAGHTSPWMGSQAGTAAAAAALAVAVGGRGPPASPLQRLRPAAATTGGRASPPPPHPPLPARTTISYHADTHRRKHQHPHTHTHTHTHTHSMYTRIRNHRGRAACTPMHTQREARPWARGCTWIVVVR